MHVIDLAKLQEDKFSKSLNFKELLMVINLMFITNPRPYHQPYHLNRYYPSQLLISRLRNCHLLNTRSWRRGLCNTYGEKLVPGHKCNSKFFLLVQQEENSANWLHQQIITYQQWHPTVFRFFGDPPHLSNGNSYAHISLYALVGNASRNTKNQWHH